MYIGQYIHTIDAKNRLFLPARYRSKKRTFILTRGQELCLFLYDNDGWKRVLQKLEDLNLPDKVQERAFKRTLLSSAYEVVPDAQGRILIPASLKEYAQIQTETMIIGVGNRLEVWENNRWNEYYRQHAESSFRDLSGQLEI
jgi:MraZ protein